MAEMEEIYGTNIRLPQLPDEVDIVNYGLPTNEQLFIRQELPDFFDNVQYTKQGDLVLSSEQEKYAEDELRKCKRGVWIYINGIARFITKKYYFYLQWWVLEDGSRPEYRDCDRRWFLFLDWWENILWCLGVIRGKKRREGASSQATSNLIYECIFYTNSNCGLISKTRDDSRDTFTDMVGYGYKHLPPFLKPKQLNKEDSVTEYVFAQKITASGQGNNRSKINYRAPVLNAYDRGRMSRLLLDEFGKLEKDTPASKLFAIISKTLIKGAKRVGFVEMPSTCNSLAKGGGEFKLMWELADLGVKKPTANRLVRYFTPAYDGYEGFIDRFGNSVIGEPTHEQYQYLVDKWVKKDEEGTTISELSEDDIKLGAKVYIANRRVGLDGELLEEEIRMNPTTEVELFMAANVDCIFDSMALSSRIEYLKQNPIFKRKVVFYRDFDQVVKWRDAEKKEESFCWEILAFPPEGQQNKFNYENGLRKPQRTDDGVIGVDGYSNSQGGKKYGSKASAWIFRKFDMLDPNNTGLFIGHLYGRPSEKDDLHNQIMLGAEFYGYTVYYEFVADDYYTYFKNRGKIGYLSRFPKNAIDPTKRNKETTERHYGFPTTDFALTKQNDAMITYIKHYCHLIHWIELCDDALKYLPDKRTPSDRTVSAMITLVGSMEQVYKQPERKKPLIRIYENV